MGGLNCVADAEGRLDATIGDVRRSRRLEYECFLGAYADFHEIIADGYSDRQMPDDNLPTSAPASTMSLRLRMPTT